MAATNRETFLREWVDRVWSHGDLSYVDRYISPDYVMHSPGAPMEVHGPADFKKFVTLFRTAVPDFTMTLDEVVEDGSRAAWRCTSKGTHTGSFLGAPPTGNPVCVTVIVVSHFKGDQYVEDYVNIDSLGMLQQFGILPQLQPAN